MKHGQRLVSFTPAEGRLRRYFVDSLGNLKLTGEAEVIPPQGQNFDVVVEEFRIGTTMLAPAQSPVAA